MKEYKVKQRCEEWFDLRRGKINASKFPKLMPTEKQKIDSFNETQENILREVACEILTGSSEDVYQSAAMKWGNDWEEIAISEFCKSISISNRDSGYWEYSDYIGGSPDSILGFEEYVCEMKCPTSKIHMKYLNDFSKWEDDYAWQIRCQMMITGIHSGYGVSYDPRFPANKRLCYSEFSLSKDHIEMMQERMNFCVKKIKEWTA